LGINNQVTLYFLATLCRASYAPTAAPTQQAANAAFGGSTVTHFTPNSSETVPGFSLIVTPGNDCIVVVSGTTNLAQWLEQTMTSSLVPTNASPIDNARAGQVYLTAAQMIRTAILALPTPPNNFLFTGHSMGGAVATVSAYLEYQNLQIPDLTLVTFAAPKAGDMSLSLDFPTSNPTTKRLVIQGDVVPALPPDPGFLAKAFTLGLPFAFQTQLAYWASYFAVNQSLSYLASDGSLSYGNEPSIVSAFIACILAAVGGQPLPIVSQHAISTYCNYLGSNIGFARQLALGWANPSALVSVNSGLAASGL
jgi:triacylglycerol lipase